MGQAVEAVGDAEVVDSVMALRLLVVGSVVISIWGAVVLNSKARFPARLGGLGPQFSVSKYVGLTLWPATAALIGLGGATIASDPQVDEGSLTVLAIVAVVVVVFGQISGILRARREQPDE